MENNGWIKLHRRLIEKGYWNKSQYVHLWVHILLIANHKPKEFMWNGSMIMVKEGQLITGRTALVKATGIPGTTIERILQMLENEHQIGQQKNNKYRLITIVNWEEYQNRTPERTTSGQQADTNKNEKKEKNTTVAVAPVLEVEEVQEDSVRTKRPVDEYQSDYLMMCDWAEKRRGFVFPMRKSQFAALSKARKLEITPKRLKDRWMELETQNREDGFDWWNVLSSFNKKV